MNCKVNEIATNKAMNAGINCQEIWLKRNVEDIKAMTALKVLTSQLLFCAARLYVRQKTHMEICPARLPIADPAANSNPNMYARMKEIGPVVSGSPTSSPFTAGPQRRPARVTVPIKKGVINNLKAAIIIIGFLVQHLCQKLRAFHF